MARENDDVGHAGKRALAGIKTYGKVIEDTCMWLHLSLIAYTEGEMNEAWGDLRRAKNMLDKELEELTQTIEWENLKAKMINPQGWESV